MVLFFFLLLSCQESPIYEEAKVVDPAHWTWDSKKEFEFIISDTTIFYDIILQVDHSTNFSFQNLYVNIGTFYPGGQEREQVLSLDMANLAGKWHAQCSADLCELDIVLQEKAFFKKMGNHTLSIAQNSRIDSLSGIHRLKLSLFQSEILGTD